MTTVEANADVKLWGIVAEFDSPKTLYEGAKEVADAGYRRVDSHTPFPIHGIEKQLRHGPSHLGWLVAGAGLCGILGAQAMQYWMNAVDYPFWVSGKEPYAWPSTIPITFELMVLLAGITAVFGMFFLNRLPRLHHPIFQHKTFHRVTDDRFYLSIEARDPKFDATSTVSFLEGLGAENVEIIEED